MIEDYDMMSKLPSRIEEPGRRTAHTLDGYQKVAEEMEQQVSAVETSNVLTLEDVGNLDAEGGEQA